MKKAAYILIGLTVIAGGIYFAMTRNSSEPAQVVKDYKNIEYTIDGQRVLLVDGVAETEAAPGSASKIFVSSQSIATFLMN